MKLMERLRAHTRHRLDDDVAVLLAELTLSDPGTPACRARPDVKSAVMNRP